jgi:hypothetical protein
VVDRGWIAARLVEGLTYLLWFLTAVAGVMVTLVCVVRRRNDGDWSYAVLFLASLLFSPLGWEYYTWSLFPPLLAIGGQCLLARQRVVLLSVLVASLWPMRLTVLGQRSAPATFTAGSIYFWGFLLLWIALLRDTPEKDYVRHSAPASAEWQPVD